MRVIILQSVEFIPQHDDEEEAEVFFHSQQLGKLSLLF